MSSPSLPEKLRDEVKSANTDDDSEHLDARRALLSSLISEFAHKTRLNVRSGESWSALRGVCDVVAAVEQFIAMKIQPLTARPDDAYRENAHLGELLQLAVSLSTVLDAWPAGMMALAEKQSSLAGELESLVKSELRCFQSASGEFSPLEVQGIGALLWLRPSISELDLGASLIPPDCVTSLVELMPTRIASLSLADTDFCKRSKELAPMRTLCSLIASSDCGLTSLSVARNSLNAAAGRLLTEAIAQNKSLTSLDTTSNEISGSVAEELAATVLAHPALTSFGPLPIGELRANEVDLELEYSGKGVRVVEARVLAALLPQAPLVARISLDGTAIPVYQFRGGSPGESEAKALRASAFEADALALIKSPGGAEAPAPADAASAGVEASPVPVSSPRSPRAFESPLVEIDLNRNSLGAPSAMLISSLLVDNTSLLRLNLSHNRIGAEGAACLAQGLKNNGTLISLSLAWNRICSEGTAALAASLLGNTSLTSLNLACNELTNINSFGQGVFNTDGVQQLADVLGKCALRALDISNNCLVGLIGMAGRTLGKYDIDGVEKLANGIPGSKIDNLVLDGNVVGAEGIGTLASALERHASLTSLSLADCTLTDGGKEMSGLKLLVECLKKQKDLKELCFDGCALGPEGATAIALWLKGASAAGGFESLFIERGGNQLDASSESALREAAGKNVMLHLERSRPAYQASLDKTEGLLREELKRRGSITATGTSGLDVTATPNTVDSLSPSPPMDGTKRSKTPRAHGSRHRRGSTGGMAGSM